MINYDGRRFRAVHADRTGEPTIAAYHQDGDLVWGEFAGGPARRGSLAGLCAPDGTLDFAYTMVLHGGQVISGRCVSTPQLLDDGRVRLHERWQRYGRHAATGLSQLEEI